MLTKQEITLPSNVVISFNGSHSEIQVGKRVNFFVEKGYDPKKNQESKQAINIEKLDNWVVRK
ncbi:MAG: hypothetical protein KKA10_18190 [Euryarchaeota archaeon]|nr:hypothetical protein [Euryarchaeota archaeon]MCG2737510.1 hypothetical protein [Candidatus Methanoperedenaceae archaeon]